MHHVIYVPGLGDRRTYGQPIILSEWRLFGVKVHFHRVIWADNEPFDKKLGKLLGKIDELQDKYGKVSLIGVSAGASAVLNAYALRPNIKNVVCICGKINNPQSVGNIVYDTNPAFKESIYKLQKSLKLLTKNQRSRILSIHPLEDRVVPPKDTIIDGAIENVVPTKGHIFSIYYSIMFRMRTICRFIKNT